MGDSGFQTLKLYLISHLSLSRDAFHVYIGLTCLIAYCLVRRCPFDRWAAVVPGLVLSTALEIVDLLDDVGFYGHPRWRASLHDLFHTNVMPVLIVAAMRSVQRYRDAEPPPERP